MDELLLKRVWTGGFFFFFFPSLRVVAYSFTSTGSHDNDNNDPVSIGRA